MFMRYVGVGIGYRHSATVAKIKFDLVEAVFESPEACFEFEDMNEESRDDGKVDGPGNVRTRKQKTDSNCILSACPIIR